MVDTTSAVSASDWVKGIALSVLASVIGGASKLAIRKSWLMVERLPAPTCTGSNSSSSSSSSSTCSDANGGAASFTCSSARRSSSNLSLESLGLKGVNSEETQHGLELRDAPPAAASVAVTPPPATPDDFHIHAPSAPQHNVGGAASSSEAKRIASAHRRALCLRGSGMVGMTLLNPLCCVLAMNYASPSILAPFSGLTLVWIVICSETLIGERPAFIQIAAAALIVLGESVVAIFGDHTNDEGKALEDVRSSYLEPTFQLYLASMVAWMSYLCYQMAWGRNQTLKRFAWGVSGGSITGLQNFLKDSLTIIKAVSAGSPSEGMAYPWYFYLLVILGMATAFVGLLFLTACMKLYDATYSAAMFVGSFVISASIMAAAHYQTFQNLVTVWNYVFYPVGLCVLIMGVLILVRETGSVVVADDGANGYEGFQGDYVGGSLSLDNESRMKEPLVAPGRTEKQCPPKGGTFTLYCSPRAETNHHSVLSV